MNFWEKEIDTGSIPEDNSHFDMIIVGGGPAGCAAAGYAAMKGDKVLLIEKGVWPRDKTCGDAVGGKSLSHVTELGVKARLEETPHFKVTGITFSSQNGKSVRVKLPEEDIEKQQAGYSLPRIRFDWLMFERCSKLVLENGGSVIQNFLVKEILFDNGYGGVDPGKNTGDERRIIGVKGKLGGVKGEDMSFTAPLTIGAAGYNCPVARAIVNDTYDEGMVDKSHYCGGFRQYWKNVEGCNPKIGDIEIHFVDSITPGYFWLFPVSENIVNVGVGMLLSETDKQKKKLRKLQEDVINNHPIFSKRFVNAELVKGSSKGWQLPFGSPRKKPPSHQPRRAFMKGGLLIGDAASLVDPFSGEGIGNALVSGKMAVNIFDSEKHNEGFPLDSGLEYQTKLWKLLGPELTNSFKLQGLSKKKWLMNWFMGKAERKPEIQNMLTDMIASKEAQGKLHSKWFLIKTILF